ncbi:ribonuclease H1 domain-containing protein [Tannockella kyphosi]|uniref:ribonuclease H1 domain-containing protein n=1 Tax=Tannockella kyphosi TaxID=2899121 RepID=UPI0020110407|nr:ribonuclease H family protein [Tannockella kyphosi]
MAKYYAVKVGKKPGIYLTWDLCKEQVMGYSGAVYKSFPSLEQANEFVKVKEEKVVEGGYVAYVDGSYNIKTKVYGYGCVILEGQQVIQTMSDVGNNQEDALMRNVAGELLGCLCAIEYAIEKKQPAISIYYDYEGIEKWAKGLWKANKPGTISYIKQIKLYQQQIAIQFVKVLAHSNDYYNDKADELAKKAVGVVV